MEKMYVIVQAGGRGSRLRHHTWNKPKCLVSVYGKPILYHLFDKFPDAHFIIIGDYLFEQLEKYLNVNKPTCEYTLVQSKDKGTCAGIASALDIIPAMAPVILTWSDLIINHLPSWPITQKPVICTTSSFTCRWTLAATGDLQERPGTINGIPGIFYFPNASMLPHPPKTGEFVRWFAANITNYETLECTEIQELGDFNTIEQNNERSGFCRFFNKVEIGESIVNKTVIDDKYASVHANEVAWYREARKLGFRRIPNIISEEPLALQRLNGQHAYQITDLTLREQRALMADYLDALISLHDLDKAPAVESEVKDVYINKTIDRVNSICQIIPGYKKESMTINGKKCRNIFSEKYNHIFTDIIQHLQPTRFVPIHGDSTFSNTIIDDKLRVWFIDPRGYFSKPGIMGDAWYDFAKVYYSAVGGYDAFNRRRFKLHIDAETIEILIEEPTLAKTSQAIFKEYFGDDIYRIKIIHGLIWLALSGYAKDDIDSIIASFYMGLYWLEDGIG